MTSFIDPTHPKLVEGDEVLQKLRNDDDVAGHVYVEENRERPVPNELGAGVTDDDVEGHMQARGRF